MRDGEEPTHSIIAVHPQANELVTGALDQLKDALRLHMPDEHIALMREEAIQLHGGDIMELGPFSLFFSLSYPTAPGRTFELQFGAPPGATLH